MMGSGGRGNGVDRGALPPVSLLAAALALDETCSVFRPAGAANDAWDEDEAPPPSGWRGLPGEPADELSHTGSWPG